MKQIKKTIFILLAGLLIFTACENSVSSHNSNNNELPQGSSDYIDFTGHFSTKGALPESIAASLLSTRSAFPQLGSASNTDINYYAKAVSGSTVIDGIVNESDGTFTISRLKVGLTWTIEVGIEVNGERSLYAKETKFFKVNDYTIEHPFFLKPDQEGNGSLSLAMTVDSSITTLNVNLDDEEQSAKWEAAEAASGEIRTDLISISELPAGIYDLTLTFYSSGVLAYSTNQTVNVIKGMCTETWCSDGTTLITGTGTDTFNLTSTLIHDYVDSVIYVGQNSYATSKGINASDSFDGKAYTPLETLSKAFTIIKNTAENRDYTIIVSGTVTGNITIDNTIDSCATSILIQGLNTNTLNPEGTSTYTDIIRGASSQNNPVIRIVTATPVTFKNIKITTGSSCNTQEGGGLYINGNNTKVTLANGAWIGNCTTNSNSQTRGAGIFIQSGTLIMKDRSAVSNNKVSTSSNYQTQGGAIYGANGTIYMEGGSIYSNIADYGAGVYLYYAKMFISGNSNIFSNSTSTATGAGGGFAVTGSASTSGKLYIGYRNADIKRPMTGKIYDNTAQKYGGGIYATDIGEIYIDSGTLENNRVTTHSSKKGGAIFPGNIYLSGSFYIPYGGEPGKNDIGGQVKINGALTPTSGTNGAMATITPSSYTRGNSFVEANNSSGITDLSQYKSYFALSDEDWYTYIPSNNKKQINMNSPIYVAGENHTVCTANGSSSGSGTKRSPFDTIDKAAELICNSSVQNIDYTIAIDGKLSASQSLVITNTDIKISISGVNEIGSDGTFTDIIDASGSNSYGLAIDTDSTALSVTISNLKITGGNATSGGGIFLAAGKLTLSNDVQITGNKAANGGGIYVNPEPLAFLQIKGNVEVFNNTDTSATPKASNILLPAGKKIIVLGPLVKGRGANAKKAKIGISSSDTINISSPLIFTQGYGYKTGGKNAGVSPSNYFIGDLYSVTDDGSAGTGECVLTINGGSIALEAISELITIEIDNPLISATNPSANVYNFTTIKAKGTANEETITSGITYSYKLLNHGTQVPSGDNGFYTTDGARLTFNSNIPVDDYVISVNANYNGRNYSANFKIAAGLYLSYCTEAPTSGSYLLNSVEELKKLRDWANANSNCTFNGVTFKLSGDIDTNGEEIIIGYYKNNSSLNRKFEGIFDGNGHTIKNTINKNTEEVYALFPYVNGSNTVIKNLTVEGTSKRGSIVGYLDGNATIENCISKTVINSTQKYTGGIVCNLEKGHVRNCINAGNITCSDRSTAGIVGHTNGGSGSIDRCINKGNISGSGQKSGIIGYFQSSNVLVTNCKNIGNITSSNSDTGGILVCCNADGRLYNNCNIGIITSDSSSSYPSGIFSYTDGDPDLKNNCNAGQAVYGIFGDFHQYNENLYAENNYCLNTCTHAFPTAKYKPSNFDPANITDEMIKTFSPEEVDSVISSLNDWAQTNSTDTIQYAGWKKRNNLPELDLGELDTLADSL